MSDGLFRLTRSTASLKGLDKGWRRWRNLYSGFSSRILLLIVYIHISAFLRSDWLIHNMPLTSLQIAFPTNRSLSFTGIKSTTRALNKITEFGNRLYAYPLFQSYKELNPERSSVKLQKHTSNEDFSSDSSRKRDRKEKKTRLRSERSFLYFS